MCADIQRNIVLQKKMRGQSMVEFVIIFPVLIFLIMGIVQWVLIYQARTTMNYATLLAARAAAMDNGSKAAMRRGLAAGIAPLFASDASPKGFAEALAKAKLETSGMASFSVLNPTTQAFSDFGQARLDAPSGSDKEIPNDTLNYRNTKNGANSGISVQDANILHLRASYCYRLVVPVVGRMINYAANAVSSFSYVLSTHGMKDPFGIGGAPVLDKCRSPLFDGPRITIQGEAVVRMQSPFYKSNL